MPTNKFAPVIGTTLMGRVVEIFAAAGPQDTSEGRGPMVDRSYHLNIPDATVARERASGARVYTWLRPDRRRAAIPDIRYTAASRRITLMTTIDKTEARLKRIENLGVTVAGAIIMLLVSIIVKMN